MENENQKNIESFIVEETDGADVFLADGSMNPNIFLEDGSMNPEVFLEDETTHMEVETKETEEVVAETLTQEQGDVNGEEAESLEIELKMYDEEELNEILKEYISNDSCNVIFTVSDKNLEMAKKDEEFNECLRKADLLLSSSNLKNEESSEGSDAGVDIEIINKIARDDEVDTLNIMLLTDDSEFANGYDEKMEEIFSDNDYAEYVGNYVISEEMDDDLLINEINGRIPEVLVCVCESPVQEKWIMQNKSKMGVKIILALTGEKEAFLQKKANGINFLAKIFGKH